MACGRGGIQLRPRVLGPTERPVRWREKRRPTPMGGLLVERDCGCKRTEPSTGPADDGGDQGGSRRVCQGEEQRRPPSHDEETTANVNTGQSPTKEVAVVIVSGVQAEGQANSDAEGNASPDALAEGSSFARSCSRVSRPQTMPTREHRPFRTLRRGWALFTPRPEDRRNPRGVSSGRRMDHG